MAVRDTRCTTQRNLGIFSKIGGMGGTSDQAKKKKKNKNKNKKKTKKPKQKRAKKKVRLCAYTYTSLKQRFEFNYDQSLNVIVLNTHLDHLSEIAREKGAEIIWARLHKLHKQFPNDPILVTGDFNSAPGQPAYTAMVDGEFLRDAWTNATHTSGASVTFHHWWGHHILAPWGSFGTAAFLTYWTGGYVPTHFNRYHIDWILFNSAGKLEPVVTLVGTDYIEQDGKKLYPSGTVVTKLFRLTNCLTFLFRSFPCCHMLPPAVKRRRQRRSRAHSKDSSRLVRLNRGGNNLFIGIRRDTSHTARAPSLRCRLTRVSWRGSRK